jgi:uncharacterized membrane protein
MLREKLAEHHHHKPHEFRWRSREIVRMEGLSDAVFGFAITLLIVALEVPRTSEELLETMRGFIPFALTFTILYIIWYRQFVFFRRYGLEDRTTAVLNGALLFVVLFFVFPLKFILSTLVERLLGNRMVRLPNGTLEPAIRPEHTAPMMTIYGLGFAALFAILALLHAHAWRQRDVLDLNELERLDTRRAVRMFSFAAAMGVLVAANANVLSLVEGKPYEDPAAFASLGVVLLFLVFVLRFRLAGRRQRRELVERLRAEGGEAPASPASPLPDGPP